ncbi:hypothetical protein K1719_039078 [Acacia pycnantha]|nr:hypothetical protein K1719_039078 [Acacia pycnantha]
MVVIKLLLETKFRCLPVVDADGKLCGPFGVCDANALPVCVCIRGFRRKNLQAWNLRNGSYGGVRNTELDYGGDKLLEMKNVKLPDTTSVFANRSMNIVECGDFCLKDCNCTAYANIEIGNGGSGCVMWSDNHVNTREGLELVI